LLPKLGTDWPIPLGVARGSKAMAALRADGMMTIFILRLTTAKT